MEYIEAMTPEPLYFVLIFVFGACIGSFLNVVIWRLPRDQKLDGRSQCPNCHHVLAWYDLVPLLSYVWLRGRCRYCQTQFSPRYFVIELVVASLFLLAWLVIQPNTPLTYFVLLRDWFVITICVAVFVIDLEHYLILDKIILPSAIAVLASNAFLIHLSHGDLSDLGTSLLAAFLAAGFFGAMWLVSKGRWMGLGDVKFAGLMGLILGFPNIVVALFFAFILGSLVGIGLLITGKKQLSSKLPFGTFLSLATVIVLFWGTSIWQWYTGFLRF